MPVTGPIQVGDRFRVSTRNRTYHCFQPGRIVTVVEIENDALWTCECEGYETTQVMERRHLEPLDAVPVFDLPCTTVERGAMLRIIAGFEVPGYRAHYFPLGMIVQAETGTDDPDTSFRARGISHGTTTGQQTQVLYPSQVTLAGDCDPDDYEPIESCCGNCGNTTRRRCENCDYCRECCECSPRSGINDASCRVYPRMRPYPAPSKSFLYLGVELEVECPDGDRHDVASEILSKHSDSLMLKDDGSLNEGFEMVTGPYALEEHKKIWGEIVKTAIGAGARSWGYKTTGLHIHLSRAFFTPLVLGKLLVFMNSEETRKQIVRLAQRESPDYAAMEKKKHTDIYNYRHDYRTGARRRTSEMIGSGNRYEALNLTPDRTVEMRIFKGTLHEGHILANLEFAHAAAYWSTECSIQDSENWASFWRYVTNHRKLYANLIKYMARKPESEK